MNKQWKSIFVTLGIASALLVIWLILYSRTVTIQYLAEQLRRNRAVIADKATIVRGASPGIAAFATTVHLFNPVLAGQLPPPGKGYVVVVSDSDRFVGDVEVAMDTYRQLGFGANAVLREGVEIFEVNENGEVRRVEAASIDYIQIH